MPLIANSRCASGDFAASVALHHPAGQELQGRRIGRLLGLDKQTWVSLGTGRRRPQPSCRSGLGTGRRRPLKLPSDVRTLAEPIKSILDPFCMNIMEK